MTDPARGAPSEGFLAQERVLVLVGAFVTPPEPLPRVYTHIKLLSKSPSSLNPRHQAEERKAPARAAQQTESDR